MTKKANKMNEVLIICTKDRPEELERLLNHLEVVCKKLPNTLLIVDSSLGNDSRVAVLGRKIGTSEVHYVLSNSGLPHQRNVGIDFAFSNFNNLGPIIFFLDDDCLPTSNFFVDSRLIMGAHPEVGVLGGFDRNLHYPPIGRLESALGIKRDAPNNISKAGFGSVIKPKEGLQQVLWVPGFAQVIRTSLLKKVRFNGKIRMYGEDVDMHLRLGRETGIFISNLLMVDHQSSKIGRDKLSQSIQRESAFRLRLSKEYPQLVSKRFVICASVILSFYCLLSAVKDRDNFFRALGHFKFLADVLLNKASEQVVNHNDWEKFSI